jgi:[acyl-carrier-protein] S-malonyltransferase
MKPLADEFSPALDAAPFTETYIPVVANATADFERSPEEIRHNLVLQLDGPVRWTESINQLRLDGFDTFVEVGPGKVLTGLTRQIAPDATGMQTGDVGALRETMERLRVES